LPVVGNDIVDLETDYARDKHKDLRFLDRVLTDWERKRVLCASRPAVLLWSLWACKEAAYKVLQKADKADAFVPRRIPVRLALSEGSAFSLGMVESPWSEILVQVEEGVGFVHAVAVYEQPRRRSRTVCRILSSGAAEGMSLSDLARFGSSKIREAAKEELAGVLGCLPGEIDIIREKRSGRPGPPVVYAKGLWAGLDLSLSHDGRFLALAYCRDHAPVP
jgi:phosphopantetheinyl transferase